MGFLTRRRLLQLAGLAGVGIVGGRYALPHLLATEVPRPLDAELGRWVDELLSGIDRSRMWDVHAHVFGVGQGDTGCSINPRVRSQLSVFERLQYDIFTSVTGVHDEQSMDADYLQRLLDLHRLGNPQGRLVLLAFDHAVDENGVEQPEIMPYYTPSEYVLRLASENDDVEAGVSIHPYREDAVGRLERAAARGARLVKWLPAAMGIDPASRKCDAFYKRLQSLGIPLLSHAGGEAAVESGDRQALGNPLRLRRPLEMGVRVIAAHCASLGEDDDLDMPAGRRIRMSSFDLFMRLMREPRFERVLTADISAVTQINRCGRPLRSILRAGELHHRLVNGSDYPLPAIDPLVSTLWLERQGYLTSRERELCNRVYASNPLLFDLVVKRCLKVREGGKVHRFAPTVFESAWLFA